MNYCRSILVLILIFGSFLPSRAVKKDSVNIYIQVTDVWDLDYNKATVMVDFYLMMEGYRNDTSKTIYLLNGEILSCDTISDDSVSRYLALQIKALLKTDFNFERFPLDQQNIIIKLEPYSYADAIAFYSKPDQNVFIDSVHLKGWKAKGILFEQKLVTYKLKENAGFKEYKYNNVFFTVPISRLNALLSLIKAFLPSIIALIIIYIGFFVPNNMLESRFNLSLGSLFVVISNLIVIQSYLPEVSSLTLIEEMNLVALFIIVLTILFFTLLFRSRNNVKVIRWIRVLYVLSSVLLYGYIGYLLFA